MGQLTSPQQDPALLVKVVRTAEANGQAYGQTNIRAIDRQTAQQQQGNYHENGHATAEQLPCYGQKTSWERPDNGLALTN